MLEKRIEERMGMVVRVGNVTQLWWSLLSLCERMNLFTFT